MIFLIESIVLCLIFTLTVPLYGLRDPLAMIDSYPPAIVARAEELGLVLRERKRRAPKVIAAKLVFCLIAAVLLAVTLRIFNGADTFLSYLHIAPGPSSPPILPVQRHGRQILLWGGMCAMPSSGAARPPHLSPGRRVRHTLLRSDPPLPDVWSFLALTYPYIRFSPPPRFSCPDSGGGPPGQG